MKILVVSLYYEPDLCQSNGPMIRALCDDWAAAGHEVTVLTSFPHYNCDSVWPEYRGRLFERDRVGKVKVFRSYIFVPRRRSSLDRILNYLSFNVSSTIAGLVTGKQDVIFVISPPLTIGLTAFILSLLKRIPYCYNLQDIWPEVAVKLGMLRGRSTIAFFERLEKFIYRRSCKIFAISEEFKTNLLGKGVPESKIEVIPNFVDAEFIRPMSKNNSFSRAHELTDKYVALYAGNIGLSQGLDVIMNAAEELRVQPEILFLIVGQGSRRDELIAGATQRGLQNVRFLPLLPETDVPLLYASCDVALIPLKRGITENSVPCKTYSIMASGRPYIASVDPGSNVWKLTEQAGCGVCVEPENGKALAAAVLSLQACGDAGRQMGSRGREYVENHFARKAITTRYRIALENLTEIASAPLKIDRINKMNTRLTRFFTNLVNLVFILLILPIFHI
jgi:colanic acid biosynthesis glycosyl transferase WcaI